MKQKLIIILISIFIFSGCSGTNQYLNNRNVLGLGGAAGGAYAGSQLCKNCKGAAKIAAIAGGSILSMFAMSKVGEWIDKKDVENKRALILDVLEKNKDNETSTHTYTKSFRNPNTGRNEQATVQQSATPLRTYQPTGIVPVPNNSYAHNRFPGGQGRNYYGPDCEVGCFAPPLRIAPGTGTPLSFGNNQMAFNQQYGSQYCRDIEITFSISVDGAPPSQNQYYRMCKTEEGWRSIG